MNSIAIKLLMDCADERTAARLHVWCTQGRLEELAFQLASELALDGERVMVIDAAGCFDPSNIVRASAPIPSNIELLRTGNFAELQTVLWTLLQPAARSSYSCGPRRVLMVGVLEHLYAKELLTRDAARALGRMKLALEAMVSAGMQVAVACRADDSRASAISVRSYLLSSLCAAADEVHKVGSAAQEYVHGPSSAIA